MDSKPADNSCEPKTPSADDAELYIGFGQECEQKVDNLEDLILALDDAPGNIEIPKEIYRILHTIKGTAASMGLEILAKFAHKFEDYIVPLRDGKTQTTSAVSTMMLKATEALKAAMATLRQGQLPKIDEKFWENQTANSSTGENTPGSPSKAKSRNILIEIGVIDQLLTYSGNITIIRDLFLQEFEAMAERYPEEAFFKRGMSLLDEMGKENDSLQRELGTLRKTKISSAIRAPQRAIRDLAVQLGKKVRFEALGTNVQIDYDLSQILADSLVHISRNAMDHGIELPEDRLQAGKPAEARITVDVSKSNDDLVTKIIDDGRGIDVERVKMKALEKQLLSSQDLAKMSEESILNLIFESGFSTANQVTEVSGRGVGLDMVMKSISDLKGRVSVSSRLQKGTEFKITIPEKKTTNIVSSFIVVCGQDKFAIPQEQVREIKSIFELKSQHRYHQRNGARFVNYESIYLEVIEPPQSLGAPGHASEERLVFILDDSGKASAVLADEVCSMDKVIVKEWHYNL